MKRLNLACTKNSLPLTMVLVGLLCLIQCKPSAPKATAGKDDLTGFEVMDIPGTAFQNALRKDAAGQPAIEGYVLNGKKSGEWMEFNNEGEVTHIEHYVEGLKEGVNLTFTGRGQIEQKARYHRGLLHGPWKQYKFGKIIEERNYENGKLDGIVKMYDDRTWKLKQEAEYKDGLQDGYFRYYDEGGNMTVEYQYKNGEKVSGGIVPKSE